MMEGEAGEFPSIARKRVLSSPRPIGHKSVSSILCESHPT
jgi:hypothetical protein